MVVFFVPFSNFSFPFLVDFAKSHRLWLHGFLLTEQVFANLPALALLIRPVLESNCLALQFLNYFGWSHRVPICDNFIVPDSASTLSLAFGFRLSTRDRFIAFIALTAFDSLDREATDQRDQICGPGD